MQYKELIKNPHDFTIKVMCVKYAEHNKCAKLIEMFNFMDKHCQDTTFYFSMPHDIQGTMCTCIGYMKASYFIENYIEMYLECNEIRPTFQLWEEYYENSEDVKEIVFRFDTNNKNDLYNLKQLKDIIKSIK